MVDIRESKMVQLCGIQAQSCQHWAVGVSREADEAKKFYKPFIHYICRSVGRDSSVDQPRRVRLPHSALRRLRPSNL